MSAPRRPRGPDRPGTPTQPPAGTPEASVRGLPTRELVGELARKASELARKEVELARAEVRADLRAEIRAASGLGVAGLCAVFTVQLLLTAVVLALMEAGLVPGWAAALIVAAVVLAIGTAVGLWSWARRVRSPLVTTRRSLQEDLRWAKAQIA
ncbi:MAG TPA: phage holin family protein [Anaeromyxobacteraceae bacterium]|nr:phage holin family protein [Anaeromyxobacteraceae bacterium]